MWAKQSLCLINNRVHCEYFGTNKMHSSPPHSPQWLRLLPSLLLLPLFVGFCVLYCYVVLNVLSSWQSGCFTLLSFRCFVTVSVLWIYLPVLWVGLHCVIVVFQVILTYFVRPKSTIQPHWSFFCVITIDNPKQHILLFIPSQLLYFMFKPDCHFCDFYKVSLQRLPNILRFTITCKYDFVSHICHLNMFVLLIHG